MGLLRAMRPLALTFTTMPEIPSGMDLPPCLLAARPGSFAGLRLVSDFVGCQRIAVLQVDSFQQVSIATPFGLWVRCVTGTHFRLVCQQT